MNNTNQEWLLSQISDLFVHDIIEQEPDFKWASKQKLVETVHWQTKTYTVFYVDHHLAFFDVFLTKLDDGDKLLESESQRPNFVPESVCSEHFNCHDPQMSKVVFVCVT